MDIFVDYKKRVTWLSYEYLMGHGVPEGTISWWSTNGVCRRTHIEGRAFLDYETIPAPSQSKLPTLEEIKAEFKALSLSGLESTYLASLREAHDGPEIVKFINEIGTAYGELSREHVTKYARRAAVFSRALELVKPNAGKGCLDALFKAFNQVYPGNYKNKSRLCMALTKARNEGVLSVAVDKRLIVKREATYGAEHQYLAERVLSHNKGFSFPAAYDKFAESCVDQNYTVPSFGWFRMYYYDNQPRIDRVRYGETVYQDEAAGRVKIIPALHVGTQWQMDGWEIPIYGYRLNPKGGKEYFFKYTLFVVMDVCSRKIIGYDIAESENTETILKALEMAVRNTGTLPFEIVADNHSWNKTKEADNLKAQTDGLGVTWTIDSNPRRKAILERAFRMLGDNHFKNYYGYIGQGIRSRIKNGITQQELKDIYTKTGNMLNRDQICTITIDAIHKYNNTVRQSLGESPAARFEASDQPNAIKVGDFVRAAIFFRKSEYAVSNGQISIQRGMHRHEYALPAEFAVQYGGKRVTVRYSDFSEIYLYDLKTDAPICKLQEKAAIHGALADQTERDRELLMRNAGRTAGINTRMRKKRESLYDAASTINPNIFEAANRVTAPKDVIKEAAQNYEVRRMLADQGIDINRVAPLPVVDELLESSLKPRRKDNRHPFAVKDVEFKVLHIQ
jgi:transposase InsO family protein